MGNVTAALARVLGAVVVLALPMVASAQDATAQAPAATTSTSDPQQQPPAPGVLTVEKVPSGWVISPDVTMSQVNKQYATIIGAYGGYLTDRTFFVGAGGYWLANNQHDLGMAYGGLVLQVVAHSDRAIGFAVKGLVGGGDSTITAAYKDVYGTTPPYYTPHGDIEFGHGHPSHPVAPPPTPITPNTQLVFHEAFFIAEPQGQVMWNVNPNVRVTFGAGYRIIAGADPVNDRLRGPIGSVSVEFGGGH